MRPATVDARSVLEMADWDRHYKSRSECESMSAFFVCYDVLCSNRPCDGQISLLRIPTK